MCGELLYGGLSRKAISNKCSGPPCDREGRTLALLPDGSPHVGAQPPFLLRWSPQFFPNQAPAVFQHDPETNRLSLCPGAEEPWVRQFRAAGEDRSQCWLYCSGCVDRYMKARGKKTPPIPFRDKASQCSQRRVSRPAAASSSHEAPESEEPEAEPEEPVEEEEPIVAEEEVAEVPLPEPPQPRPSLEE